MYLSTNALKAFEFVAPKLIELVLEIDPTPHTENIYKILEDVLTYKTNGEFRFFPSITRLEMIYDPLAPGIIDTFPHKIARERASPCFRLVTTPIEHV